MNLTLATDELGGNVDVRKGNISMVNVGKHSGGSQFYVHMHDNTFMRGSTVVFGT